MHKQGAHCKKLQSKGREGKGGRESGEEKYVYVEMKKVERACGEWRRKWRIVERRLRRSRSQETGLNTSS